VEFRGRQWNLALSQMMALAVYRPLASRYGRTPALAASFRGSGLRHELAISMPVRAGYGLPRAYLALHGVLSLIEHRLAQPLDLAESESCPPGLNFADIREIRAVSPGDPEPSLGSQHRVACVRVNPCPASLPRRSRAR
jgi:hypothetical protein